LRDILGIDLRKGRVAGSRELVVHVQPVTPVRFAGGKLRGSNRVRRAENDGGSHENSREPLRPRGCSPCHRLTPLVQVTCSNLRSRVRAQTRSATAQTAAGDRLPQHQFEPISVERDKTAAPLRSRAPGAARPAPRSCRPTSQSVDSE